MTEFYKLLSVLLQYPTQDLLRDIPALREMVKQFEVGEAQKAVQCFLDHIDSTDLTELQEEYTRTFDLSPRTSMHLTFHVCGDSAERGMALAELNRLYRTEGYEIAVPELPDFFPLMLEFISVCDAYSRAMLLARFGDPISELASHLREQASPYASLVSLLSTLHPALVPPGERP